MDICVKHFKWKLFFPLQSHESSSQYMKLGNSSPRCLVVRMGKEKLTIDDISETPRSVSEDIWRVRSVIFSSKEIVRNYLKAEKIEVVSERQMKGNTSQCSYHPSPPT